MLASTFGGFWDTWEAELKVTFDGPNRLIYINPGVTSLEVRADLFSAWKKWMLFNEANNLFFLHAFTGLGGDPISDTAELGTTFFLENGWRIKPWDGHSAISITGNIYVREGGRPIVVDNNGVDAVALTVSNLVDTVVVDVRPEDDQAPPMWDGPIGIIDCYQDGKFITARWSAANDANRVRYKVYISNTDTYVTDPINYYGSFTGNMANISTEADGVTPLSSQDYYITVTAIDESENETSNTNYAIVNYDLAAVSPLTAQEIWEYTTQTNAFATLGLTDEQLAKLNDILSEIVADGQKTRNTVLAN